MQTIYMHNHITHNRKVKTPKAKTHNDEHVLGVITSVTLGRLMCDVNRFYSKVFIALHSFCTIIFSSNANQLPCLFYREQFMTENNEDINNCVRCLYVLFKQVQALNLECKFTIILDLPYFPQHTMSEY